eukprot:TRINITY_DN9287_c0_g1_i3.p1 TRINITY_DN9287_c0_g1~~TRINITY_DN9287_c0_g1_i3.p1  ORF type:complete len:314 (+),score=86.60 TRINITY_DN9287_c0_g1_i3:64-1005(+)
MLFNFFYIFFFFKQKTAYEMLRSLVGSEMCIRDSDKTIRSAGGGAFKFGELVEKELGIQFEKVDELEALVLGFRFLCRYSAGNQNEVYSHTNTRLGGGVLGKQVEQVDPTKPCLLVNIGSGVSILKVHPDGSFERVGGTSMGGATFWGLCRLITSASTFEEAMTMCESGDATKVDKLVRDIYGGDYDKFNLKGSVVAASFGKLASIKDPKGCHDQDLALALLIMITQQIALISINIAKIHHVQDAIFFVGGFLRFNPIARRTLAFAAEYQGTTAHFLEHADFFGAIGALVAGFDISSQFQKPASVQPQSSWKR